MYYVLGVFTKHDSIMDSYLDLKHVFWLANKNPTANENATYEFR